MIIVAFIGLALSAAVSDPLTPARDGQVQCYTPNVPRKTCRAIGSYHFEADGRIVNDAETMLNEEPLVVMRARDEVYVRDGAVCATDAFQEGHIQSVEIDGAKLEGADLSSVRSGLAARMREALGSGELCSTYHPQADGSFRAVVTMDGIRRADAEDTVLWVRREDGWRVAP